MASKFQHKIDNYALELNIYCHVCATEISTCWFHAFALMYVFIYQITHFFGAPFGFSYRGPTSDQCNPYAHCPTPTPSIAA